MSKTKAKDQAAKAKTGVVSPDAFAKIKVTNPATATQGEESKEKGAEVTKGEEAKPEVKVFERPAEACEVWGENDPNSRICKTCPVFDVCKEYTASLNVGKEKKVTGRRARAAHDGNFTQFGHCKATSQAGLIELALDKPTSIEELMAAANCTKSRVVAHLGFLNKKTTCKKVADEGGKFHYELVKEETPSKEVG